MSDACSHGLLLNSPDMATDPPARALFGRWMLAGTVVFLTVVDCFFGMFTIFDVVRNQVQACMHAFPILAPHGNSHLYRDHLYRNQVQAHPHLTSPDLA